MSSSGRDAFRARVAAAKKKQQSKPPEPAWAVGISLFVAGGPAERPETVEAYVEAFLSDVWMKPLRQLISQSVGGCTHPRRAGLVTMAERPAVLRELLVHPDLWEVTLSHRDKTTGHHESFDVGTRHDSSTLHARVYGYQTLGDDPARASDFTAHGFITGITPWCTPTFSARQRAFTELVAPLLPPPVSA